MKKYNIIIAILLLIVGFFLIKKENVSNSVKISPQIGGVIDQFNGVDVHYNGSVGNVSGRNVTKDGYNIGQKYQCVEFVKRYYLEALNHRMPNSYGHAKDFFDPNVKDGKRNRDRNLIQFTNPSRSKPKVSDLIVHKGNRFNPYGHVCIISKVTNREIEIVQQNPGKFGKIRRTFSLKKEGNKWKIEQSDILGWLRKK